MNKEEHIEKLVDEYGLTKQEAEEVFEGIFEYAMVCFRDCPEDYIDITALCADMASAHREAMYNL